MGDIRRYRLFVTFLAVPVIIIVLIVVVLMNLFGGAERGAAGNRGAPGNRDPRGDDDAGAITPPRADSYGGRDGYPDPSRVRDSRR